jgi:protein required for attachment to host cells
MVQTRDAWFVVADQERARLLRATAVRHGHRHVEEIDRLGSTFRPGEHHRPSRLGQPGHMASTGHEAEERLAHFARELAGWLRTTVAARSMTACPLFAPSHVLGALRRELSQPVAALVREQAVELAGLSAEQLAEHPRIAALLAG